ncbi:hypothetical protein ACFVTE_18975 [Arthrobacter sp. NPDC058097]|uniref:hypothetical protein n=1 Tax=Arthrobacter sp. NPDC058097 TaxID=3346340 RepID=UPI0036DB8E7B
MTLRGKGFMAVWHDIKAEGETEYNQWHTVEHMPERVGTPGFLAGRRYVDWNLPEYRYFTLYEGEELETFASEEYRRRLNNPTEWTFRMQPNFLNFARSACLTVSTTGLGTGGALATIRLNLTDEADFISQSRSVLETASALHGISGIHLGVARTETTRIKTKETELRADTGEDVFDAVVMIEGIGRAEVEEALKDVEMRLANLASVTATQAATYDLAYQLTTEDLNR